MGRSQSTATGNLGHDADFYLGTCCLCVSGIGLGPPPHFLWSLAQLCKVGVAMPNLETGKQSSRLCIIRISN